MDEDLNKKIKVVKDVIKAIPPEMYGKYKPAVNEFYKAVTQMEAEYQSYAKQLNELKSSMNNNITSGSNIINDIIKKIAQVSIESKDEFEIPPSLSPGTISGIDPKLDQNTQNNKGKVNLKNSVEINKNKPVNKPNNPPNKQNNSSQISDYLLSLIPGMSLLKNIK